MDIVKITDANGPIKWQSMHNWLRHNCLHYTEFPHGPSHYEVRFKYLKDAVMFQLKWG